MVKTENVIFCTECGNKNSKVNSFCLNCGNELAQEKLEYINVNNKNVNTNATTKINTNRINTSVDYLDTDDMNLFISKKTEYYNQKFEQITKTGNKRTWNWAAFFCNIYWFLYRKMYAQAGIIFLISIVASMIPFVGPIVNLGMVIGIGMYANSIYLDNANKKLNEIDAMGYEPKESMIMKKGGTNIAIPLIIVGINVLFVVFIAGLFRVLFGSAMYY